MTDRPVVSSDLDAEHELLLACVRCWLNGERDVPAPGPIRWPVLRQRLQRHGLVGLVYPVLQRHLSDRVPDEVLRGLREAAMVQAAHNLRLADALREIDAALRGGSVRYALLKGLPLASELYGSLSARRCRDLDVLVDPDQFRAAREILGTLGYSADWELDAAEQAVYLRFAPDLPLLREDGVIVELHQWIDVGRIPEGVRWARMMLDRARPHSVGELMVPAVSGLEALPYLARHGTQHAWLRLFWLVDVATVTARASDRELAEAWADADRLDARSSLALAWRLSREWLGVPVPPVAAEAAGSRRVDRMAGHVRPRVLGPDRTEPDGTPERRIAGLRWWLTLSAGPGGKAGVIARYLWTVQPDDIRAVPLPRFLHRLYPLVRAARVVGRALGALARRLLARP